MAGMKSLHDAVAQLEPPVLGQRLDMLEEALRLLNERTSQTRRDFVELREWVVLERHKGAK